MFGNKKIIAFFKCCFAKKINPNKKFIRCKKYPDNSKKILIHVYGTSNVLNALVAARKIFGTNIELDAIVTPLSVENEKSVFRILKIFKEVSSIKNLTLKEHAMLENLVNKDFKVAEEFIFKKLNYNNYDGIIYSHTCLHIFANILKKLFPEAKTVSFGDTWGGYISRKKFLEANTNKDIDCPYPDTPDDVFCNLFAYTMYGEKISSEIAAVSTDELKEIFDIINKKERIAKYCDRLLSRFTNQAKYLYMTENLTEGGAIDFKNEIKMHIEIIDKSIPKNSVIIVKSHPHESFCRIKPLRKHFGNLYKFVEFDKKYNFYPIELFTRLVAETELNICNGLPCVTLHYLYKVKTFNPSFKYEGIFDKFFTDKKIAKDKSNLSFTREALKNYLLDWDRKHIIDLSSCERKSIV